MTEMLNNYALFRSKLVDGATARFYHRRKPFFNTRAKYVKTFKTDNHSFNTIMGLLFTMFYLCK